METRFEHGTASFGSNQFNGSSVADLRDNFILVEFLTLSGGETVEVRSVNDSTFRAVSDSYLVQEGDTVVFRQATGGKGI
jgi:hypothetical protein